MAKSKGGLQERGRYWHADTSYLGVAIRGSTRCASYREAVKWLDGKKRQIYNQEVNGIQPESSKTWQEAVDAYVTEKIRNNPKKMRNITCRLNALLPYLPKKMLIRNICNDSFIEYREDCRARGMKGSSINRSIEVVRAVLNYVATKGASHSRWLAVSPKFVMESRADKETRYVLSYEEEDRLYAELPGHLERMARFMAHTLLRPIEICQLQWSWLREVPGIGLVFLIPGSKHKNEQPKAVVLNSAAEAIINSFKHRRIGTVFTYLGRGITRMNGRAWNKAVKRAGLEEFHVVPYCVRHTGCTRLEHLAVSERVSKRIMGHKMGDITHDTYSRTTLEPLKIALEKLCQRVPLTIIQGGMA
jgi:integrase